MTGSEPRAAALLSSRYRLLRKRTKLGSPVADAAYADGVLNGRGESQASMTAHDRLRKELLSLKPFRPNRIWLCELLGTGIDAWSGAE
jgi:hypothetical protein